MRAKMSIRPTQCLIPINRRESTERPVGADNTGMFSIAARNFIVVIYIYM